MFIKIVFIISGRVFQFPPPPLPPANMRPPCDHHHPPMRRGTPVTFSRPSIVKPYRNGIRPATFIANQRRPNRRIDFAEKPKSHKIVPIRAILRMLTSALGNAYKPVPSPSPAVPQPGTQPTPMENEGAREIRISEITQVPISNQFFIFGGSNAKGITDKDTVITSSEFFTTGLSNVCNAAAGSATVRKDPVTEK